MEFITAGVIIATAIGTWIWMRRSGFSDFAKAHADAERQRQSYNRENGIIDAMDNPWAAREAIGGRRLFLYDADGEAIAVEVFVTIPEGVLAVRKVHTDLRS